jgi:glycosyltransferase involved in cell wall biosynthesis
LFSIAIPAIKAIYFEEALQSILNQTYKNYEIIICDYSKTNDIFNIYSKYQNDERIRYYKLVSKGIIEDWNRCIDYATKEYFILFSDDDIYEKNFLETVEKYIKKYPQVSIFNVRARIIDDFGKQKQICANAAEYENVLDFIWHRFKGYRFQYAADFIVKTEKLKQIGGFIPFPDAWYSDDATWFTLADENGIVHIPDILFNYRDSRATISQTGKLVNKIIGLNQFEIWIERFLQNKKITDEKEISIYNDILKIKNYRFVTIVGNILSIGIENKKYFGFVIIILRWIKTKKYSKHVNLQSLFWAFALYYKKLRNSQ